MLDQLTPSAPPTLGARTIRVRGHPTRGSRAAESDAVSKKNKSLEVVVAAWLYALPRQDHAALSALLAPTVVWHGVRPDLICRHRGEVLDNIIAQPVLPAVERVELLAVGDERVVLGIYSPELTEVAGEALQGQVWDVFTIRDGLIVAIAEFKTRDEALKGAGRASPSEPTR